jgi:magnesium-transporting ATPase (P-type)
VQADVNEFVNHGWRTIAVAIDTPTWDEEAKEKPAPQAGDDGSASSSSSSSSSSSASRSHSASSASSSPVSSSSASRSSSASKNSSVVDPLRQLLRESSSKDPKQKQKQKQEERKQSRGDRPAGGENAGGGGRLQMMGLIALHDPPREDSEQTIRKLQELGCRVIMLTGDALPIAKEVGEKVGIGKDMYNLAEWRRELEASGQTPNSVEVPNLSHASGYAEVFPEDKHAIVVQLQKRKHIVGMTGDGVNDAPALRQAEVGVAVSNATDVAKSAARCVKSPSPLSLSLARVRSFWDWALHHLCVCVCDVSSVRC